MVSSADLVQFYFAGTSQTVTFTLSGGTIIVLAPIAPQQKDVRELDQRRLFWKHVGHQIVSVHPAILGMDYYQCYM